MSTISSLATSKYITDKNYGYRNASDIKFIIPHHMAGKMTGASCAYYFVNNGLENSANYCIGYGGDISCNVYEDYGAWTSSFGVADRHAITMEISDTSSPTNWSTLAGADWTIPAAAQEAFIKLCVDLFKRYPSLGGKAVYDPNDAAIVVKAKANQTVPDTKGNILLHQWTSNYGTSCPEWHMKQILPSLVEEINRRLGASTTTTATTTTTTVQKDSTFNVAQAVINGSWGNGQARINALTKAGYVYDTIKNQVDLMLGKTGYGEAYKDMLSYFPTLSKGSTESCFVKIAQAWLAKAGYYTGSIDGDYGNLTVQAVKDFQTNINKVYGKLTVSGAIDKSTWERFTHD